MYVTESPADPLVYEFACFVEAKRLVRAINFVRQIWRTPVEAVCVSSRRNTRFCNKHIKSIAFIEKLMTVGVECVCQSVVEVSIGC